MSGKPGTRFGLAALTAACLLSFSGVAIAGDSQRTQPLIAVLQSNAGLFEKARACQQLGEFGTDAAVPGLAALLSDAHLSAYARSGLEGIGGAQAAAALRASTSRLTGNLLAGVVNSIGVLRDEQSVEILNRLAHDPRSGVAAEAFSALGKISNQASIAILEKSLSAGPDGSRPGAAAGCLLAAEQQLREGNTARARALYEGVLKWKLPAAYRMGAVRGAILARKSDRVAFLIRQLRSSDLAIRNGALITIREVPSDELARALNGILRQPKPEIQLQVLAALADCHNGDSLHLLERKMASDEPEVRKTALRVLAKIGDPGEAGFLLQTVATNRSSEEISIAMQAIERFEDPKIDALVLKALAESKDPEARIRFIRLVDARGMTNANPELLRQARDADAQARVAAFEALKSRAGANELPALMVLTKACQNDSVRHAAEIAVYGACVTMGDPGAAAVLTELKQSAKSAEKNSWVKVLTLLGYAPALPTIEAMLDDADPNVVNNALDELGQWPDPTPVEALFKVAETSANPQFRQRGLAAAIQLCRAAAEEQQRSDAVVVSWLERAARDSGSIADRRLIISGLGHVNHPDSLRLLLPYLDDPALQTEAGVAVLQIAPALVKLGSTTPLDQAIDKISANSPNPDTREQARKIAQSISNRKGVPLFDGRSLAGWEGDTNVWRVRDGVILGGSMTGNPRNEFLATTRSYTNFILRLEYKLVGTEGFINSGVQFHSVRVVQPPNEMSGYQADIGAGYSGCLYDESRRNTFLARPPEEQIKRLERPGDWNRYEVRCDGSHIQIVLNGERTVDYSESDGRIGHNGLIGLQIHGGSKAEVSFRNLIIEERP
ncbi:MAG TPA: HEAT repeat domain-containing protein [Verrucomicrobiae bacterium]|nr:HEAT repeat domain-containing protein [Verrucomicrobiae bacterium]